MALISASGISASGKDAHEISSCLTESIILFLQTASGQVGVACSFFSDEQKPTIFFTHLIAEKHKAVKNMIGRSKKAISNMPFSPIFLSALRLNDKFQQTRAGCQARGFRPLHHQNRQCNADGPLIARISNSVGSGIIDTSIYFCNTSLFRMQKRTLAGGVLKPLPNRRSCFKSWMRFL